MHFGQIVEALRELPYGTRFAREGWNGRHMWIRLVCAHDGEPSHVPRLPVRSYVEMKDAGGWLVPWVVSQTDLLADDWAVLGPGSP